MSKSGVEIFGIKELDEIFSTLMSNERRNVMVSAFRQIAKPIIKDSRTNITGAIAGGSGLRKSIGVRPVRREVAIKVGARSFGGHRGQLGYIFDQGTKERGYYTKNGVYHRTGKIEPTRFFSDAVEGNDVQIKSNAQEQLVLSFNKWISRRAKKKARI